MTSRLLLALLLAIAPSLAGAAAVCSFSSTPAMGFGAYDDSSGTPDDSSTGIVVSCFRVGGPADVTVTMQIGASSTSGSITGRQMASGANRMNYGLYRDSGRSQNWGNTAGVDAGTITITNISNFGSKSGTFTVYGRIPALQNVAAGSYSDTVQLTISP